MSQSGFVRGRILLALQQLDAQRRIKGAIWSCTSQVGEQMAKDLERFKPTAKELSATYDLKDQPGCTVTQWIKRLGKPGDEGRRAKNALRRRMHDMAKGKFKAARPKTGEYDRWTTVNKRATMSIVWGVQDFEARTMEGVPRAALQKWAHEKLGLDDEFIRDTIDRLARDQYFLIEPASDTGDTNGDYVLLGDRAEYEQHYLYLLGKLYPMDREHVQFDELRMYLKRSRGEA